MKTHLKLRILAITLILTGLLAGTVRATNFADNFDTGASPLWGNESGNWASSSGVYHSQEILGYPHAYSSLPFNLQNFTVDVDIYGVNDGGIWLRSDGPDHGVLLVTGGYSGTTTALYWHETNGLNDPGPVYNMVDGLFNHGDNIHLHIEVVGDTYSAFLNGSTTPTTTFVTPDFSTGKVALMSRSDQNFDNFALTPEPATLLLLGFGGLMLRRRIQN